jgi:hypothetical protein
MEPAKHDIKIWRGGTFSLDMSADDASKAVISFDLYQEIVLQIRPAWQTKVNKTPIAAPLLELSLANGRIVLKANKDGVEDTVLVLTISAADTAALKFSSGQYEMELIITDGSPEAVPIVDKWLYGKVTVTGEIAV